MPLEVRVRKHPRRQFAARRAARPREPKEYSPKVLKVAVDEAFDILQHQGSVIGYRSEAEAAQVRAGLWRRGVRTGVFAEVGPPATATSALEDRELRKLGFAPGTRHLNWGVRKGRESRIRNYDQYDPAESAPDSTVSAAYPSRGLAARFCPTCGYAMVKQSPGGPYVCVGCGATMGEYRPRASMRRPDVRVRGHGRRVK